MLLLRNALIFILFATYANPAKAMPRYDPEGHCQQVASVGGGSSAMIYNGCLQNEQTHYDQLKTQWAELPDQMRQHCDQVARVGGFGSYMILKGCIDNELRAVQRKPEFKF